MELRDEAMARRSERGGKAGGGHRRKTGGRHSKVVVVGGGWRAGGRYLGPGAGRAKTTGLEVGLRGGSEMPTVEE